jgi:hypothetical protein
MLKPLIAVLIALFFLSTSSLAQNLGSNITTTFYAEDVQAKPGKLEIDPSSHAILRFYDEVKFAFSRRSDILKALPKGSDVVLYAMTEKAETDLSVLVDGKWHFFSVTIRKGAGLHYYEIKKRETVSTTTSTVDNNAVIPTPKPATPSSASLLAPDWIRWNLNPIFSSSNEIRVAYTLENTGNQSVIAPQKDLRILRDGQALEFRLENTGEIKLDPGEVFNGIIRIKATPGALKFQWNLHVAGSTKTFTLEAELK